MPRVVRVSHSVPPYELLQKDVKAFARTIFNRSGSSSGDGSAPELIERLLSVFDGAQIERRYFSSPIEWFGTEHSFTEVNDLYIESALALSEKAICRVATECGLETTDFDIIFFVSTTGLSTPSMDARLFNRIKLNPHIKRVPIWGLGCAAGAASLARAAEYLIAFPTHRALIVSVELCGLAFRSELSKSNLVATALFGDGAAACVMVGDEVSTGTLDRSRQPEVLASLSTTYPDTLDVMNWRITSEGFQVGLSKDIPSIVRSLVRENISEFLTSQKIALSEIATYVMHPGGAKVLKAYAEGLELPLERFVLSTDVLKDFGNMSSATIFFVLEAAMADPKRAPGFGLASALGPGFSSELVLLKWNAPQ